MLKQITDQAKKPWFIPAVIAVAVIASLLFFKNVVRSVLVKLGLIKSASEVVQDEYDAKNTAAVLRGADAAIQYQYSVQPPTKSDAEWLQIANTIYEDLHYTSLDDNKDDAVYQLCRVQNDTDVQKLIQVFSRRSETWFFISQGEKTLPEWVRSNLSTTQIGTINNNYSRKNIKYRW